MVIEQIVVGTIPTILAAKEVRSGWLLIDLRFALIFDLQLQIYFEL